MYTEQALKQAILKAGSGNLCGTIHHSDQGVQYACDAYIRILMEHHIRISMTEDSKPTDNAVAERMNGTLKNEWIYAMSLFKDEEDARMQIAGMIDFYNNERPHMSIGMKKPMDVYSGEVPGKCLIENGRYRCTARRPTFLPSALSFSTTVWIVSQALPIAMMISSASGAP